MVTISMNRVEKLCVIQAPATEHTVEEQSRLTNAIYELDIPYGNEAAVQVMAAALEAHRSRFEVIPKRG